MRYRTLFHISVLSGLMLWTAPAAAQDEMAEMMAAWQRAGQPGVHHEHLARLVGTWEAETKMWTDPAGEPTVTPATAEYRMVMDGRYLEESITSEFMGQPFSGRGLYAYNNLTGEVQAIWIDNMSTALFAYEGSLNEAGDEMTLTGKYMDPMTKEWKETRSVMRFSESELLYVSYEVVNGQEQKMMEISGRRMTP